MMRLVKTKYNFILYYLIIFVGLIMVSWITWTRFIRSRTIRDIPDDNFTELRFWILLYLCFIYLFVIKSIIKPRDSMGLIAWLSDLFFTPFIRLDHFLKYNPFIKPYYYTFIFFILTYSNYYTPMKIRLFYIVLYIIPRTILASFLLLDTFYFHRIELFYKVILLGLLPFISRYIFYTIKDIYNHWIEILEQKYHWVFIFEKGYESIIERKRTTLAKYHYEKVSIKEYIEIKYENILNNLFDDDFPYEYVHDVIPKGDILRDFQLKKYKNNDIKLTMEDYKEIDKLFEELMPQILELKTLTDKINYEKSSSVITKCKIAIFSIYLICWSTILSACYYFYPVEFNLFKYFCTNLMMYLSIMDDPFLMLYGYSLRKNLVTIETVKTIFKAITTKIFKG